MNALPEDKRKRYQEILATWGPFLNSIAPFVIDNFRTNSTGYEFRDWFIDRKGIDTYGQFRTPPVGVTAQELTDLTQMHDFLKTVMQPPEKVLSFFTEFLTEPGQEPPGTIVDE